MSKRLQGLFGKRLKEARHASKRGRVQQDAIAVALDVSRTTISNIERGRHRVFLDQVYSAASELGVNIQELLPTLDEVFPGVPMQTAPDASLTPQSVRTATDLAKSIQERAARSELVNATGQITRDLSRS